MSENTEKGGPSLNPFPVCGLGMFNLASHFLHSISNLSKNASFPAPGSFLAFHCFSSFKHRFGKGENRIQVSSHSPQVSLFCYEWERSV
jgi:hypothetical protein